MLRDHGRPQAQLCTFDLTRRGPRVLSVPGAVTVGQGLGVPPRAGRPLRGGRWFDGDEFEVVGYRGEERLVLVGGRGGAA